MPDIVDLKRTPEDKKEIQEDAERSFSESDYPYGLNLHLEDTEMRKLNAEALDVGDEVVIYGTAKISSKRMSEVEGGLSDGSMGIQITGLSLEKPDGKSAAEKLYGGNTDGTDQG